ncbi:ascorbate transporter, chloroplastic [Trichonephila clavipes]|nr:ascorbate transporter, chloroplastic [Trichonephila clavipes]
MRDPSVKTTSFHSAALILLSSHHWWRRRLWFCVKGRPSYGRLADRPLCCKRRRMIVGASAASKFGGKTVMTFAVFLWSLSTVITPYIASSLSLLIICRILLGLGEGIGLPTVFNIFAHAVPVEERSRAFGYLVASGTAGQTVAALICPHLPWPWMFYTFGSLGIFWVILWLVFYMDYPTSGVEELPLVFPKVTNVNVRWIEFISHWSLWAIYIAHFAMNWSNYIIMQWLPTYLSRNLGADQKDVSLTAMPYLINTLCGVAIYDVDEIRWKVVGELVKQPLMPYSVESLLDVQENTSRDHLPAEPVNNFIIHLKRLVKCGGVFSESMP